MSGFEFGHPLHPISLKQQQMSLDEIKRAKVGLYQVLPYDLSHRIGVMNALSMDEYWDEQSDRFDDLMREVEEYWDKNSKKWFQMVRNTSSGRSACN